MTNLLILLQVLLLLSICDKYQVFVFVNPPLGGRLLSNDSYDQCNNNHRCCLYACLTEQQQ